MNEFYCQNHHHFSFLIIKSIDNAFLFSWSVLSYCLLQFYLFLPSMGWLCGVGVFGLIECSHFLPALYCWLILNNNYSTLVLRLQCPWTVISARSMGGVTFGGWNLMHNFMHHHSPLLTLVGLCWRSLMTLTYWVWHLIQRYFENHLC